MKRFLKSSFSLFLAITIVFSSAAVGLGEVDFSGVFAVKTKAASLDDLSFELNDDGESYSVIDCDISASGELAIPDIYNGFPVTSIGYVAFTGCTNLTAVTIGDSVTSIGGSSFSNCTNLTSITIPDSVTSIGSDAFYDCTNLTSITIPNSVTSIGWNAFRGCTSLTAIDIPDSVTCIDDNTFYSCDSLSSITIPDTVTSIASNAFYNTGYYNNSSNWEDNVLYIGNHLIKSNTSLSGECVIKDGTKTIANDAFRGCTSLTSITIPDSVTSIGDYAFYNTGYYNNSSNWEDNVLYIGNHLIKSNTSLSGEYVIKDGTKTIANDAFRGCTSLTAIDIPDSVTSIGDAAFRECTSLTSIEIPDSVTSIGADAFGYCESLTKVNIKDIDAWCNIDIENYSASPLYYAKNLYLNGELVTEVIIPDGVTQISPGGFCCESLTSIEIPDSVTNIGEYAFYKCTSLTSITIPDSVTHIGVDAFHECYGLSSVYINDIDAWCNIDFKYSYDTMVYRDGLNSSPLCYADNLYINGELATEIIIPYGVTRIPSYGFSCSNLTSITIPDSVTNISGSAFAECTSLSEINVDNGNLAYASVDGVLFNADKTTIVKYPVSKAGTKYTIPNGVTSIDNCAFDSCNNLETVTIPHGVTSIGEKAFVCCNSLTSITIPEGVVSIGSWAFWACHSLTSVEIPDSVTSIGWNAFGQSSITSIKIPDGVTILEGYTFDRCDSLSSVTLSDSLTTINGLAFSGCNNLISIELPDSLTFIRAGAFESCNSLTSITIPDSVTSIGSGVFGECEKLETVKLSAGLWCITEDTFNGCSALDAVIFPMSITKVDEGAFFGCGEFDVYYEGTEAQWKNVVIASDNESLINARIHFNTDKTNWESHYNEHVIIAPTCTLTGSQVYICPCGFEKTIEIPVIEHNYVDDVCSVCGKENLPESEHPYSENCDNTQTIYKEGATNIDITFSEDTYTESGYDKIYIYDGEDTLIGTYSGSGLAGKTINVPSDTVKIRLTSDGSNQQYGYKVTKAVANYNCIHKNANWIVDIQATCETNGSRHSVCEACGETVETQTIYAIGHTESEWITTIEPTCETQGSKYKECTVCSEKLETATIAKVAHKAGSLETTKKATCTATGTKVKKCTVCKAVVETATIAKVAHKAGSWEITKKATVNKAGEKVKKCTVCKATVETAKIAQLKCSKPKLSKVENTTSGVKITWGKVSGADKYYVCRKTSGSYKKIATTTKTYYTDKTAKTGKKYYYVVKAVNEAGSSSSSSSLSKYYLADPTLKTPKSTKKGITLNWSKVTGAQGYVIYYKTGSGSYKKLTTVKGKSKVKYTHTKAKKSKTYTYKVKAYYSKTYSAYSNTKKIKDKY